MKLGDIIRSGWWVLVAAVVVSLLVVAAFIHDFKFSETPGSTTTISLEPCLVDPGALVTAMARDGLRSLTAPSTMRPEDISRRNEEERGKILVSSDRVIGVEIGGEARAYPLRLLRWHEAVNDVVGGRPVAVTYSPLSGGIAVWDRRLDGNELEFGISGRLFNSNTLLYDRRSDGEPSSLWHQLTGEAIAGPAAGSRLTPLPARLQTWSAWLEEHPDTTIMAPDPDSKRLYKRDPYHSYRGSDVLRFPVEPLPPEGPLALKELVAIVTAGEVEAAFSLHFLVDAVGDRQGVWAALLDEEVYLVGFDAEAATFAVEPRDADIPDPPVRYAYWFEWYSLHPGVVPLP